MVNARISAEEMAWLEELAERRGISLSAALRRAIWLARQFELVQQDYRARGGKRSGRGEPTAVWEVMLGFDLEQPQEGER